MIVAKPTILSQSPTRTSANEVLSAKQQQAEAKESLPALFIQRKPSVGDVEDPLEKEADEMADKVMRMKMSGPINFSSSPNNINRKCTCEDEGKQLQRKESNNEAISCVPQIVHEVVNSSGKPLDTDSRLFMESRFNYDFSSVRIHDNNLAAKSASSINALAYTSGKDIVFNSGQYNASAASGKRLLAHELTHVVQQLENRNTPRIQRSVEIKAPYPITPDLDPADQFKKQDPPLGRSVPILNGADQAPIMHASKFENALNLPTLAERNLNEISRPDLSDPELDPVRNNLVEVKKGHFGKRVKLIQEALIAWGQGLDEPVIMLPQFGADKIYGQETHDAVVFFQQKHEGLKQDGVVGDLTLAELQEEMDNLQGSIFTIATLGHNEFTGNIHIPPPSSQWKTTSSTVRELQSNVSVLPAHRTEVRNQCPFATNFTVMFREDGSIIPSLLAHEQLHETDQVKTIMAHLQDWDTRLGIAQLLNIRIRAKKNEEAMNLLWNMAGVDTPRKLSEKIVNEWIADNRALHTGPLNVVPLTSLDITACRILKFTYRINQ